MARQRIGILARVALAAVRQLGRFVPASMWPAEVARLTKHHVASLPPDDGLRLLFDLDARLYSMVGTAAIAYGQGTHTKHRHMRYHDFFVQHVSPGQRVLDLGCGIGAVAHDVAQRSEATVVGIDLSEKNIAQAMAEHAHERVTYHVGDVLTDLPGERFDVVILSNVLEHLPGRPDFLRRVQAVTGARTFLIRVPTFDRDWRVPLKKELGAEWRLDPTHETEFTVESFREEMAAAGLVIESLQVRWGEIWSKVVVDGTPD